MLNIRFFKAWFGFFVCCFGGGGGSSTSATTTTSTDKRMVVDTGVGVSSDSSTVNVSTLDGGAISSAFDFASMAGGSAENTVSSAFDFALKAGQGTENTVSSAFDFAELAGQSAEDTVFAALKLADTVYSKGLSALDRNVELVSRSGDMVATAYDQAKGSGSEYRLMALGALALVGVVAFKSFGKK